MTTRKAPTPKAPKPCRACGVRPRPDPRPPSEPFKPSGAPKRWCRSACDYRDGFCSWCESPEPGAPPPPVTRVFSIPLKDLPNVRYEQLAKPGALLVQGLGAPLVIDLSTDVLTLRGVRDGAFVFEHTPGGA